MCEYTFFLCDDRTLKLLLTSSGSLSAKEYNFSPQQSLFSNWTQLFVLAASKELRCSVSICIIQQVLLALQRMSNDWAN